VLTHAQQKLHRYLYLGDTQDLLQIQKETPQEIRGSEPSGLLSATPLYGEELEKKWGGLRDLNWTGREDNFIFIL